MTTVPNRYHTEVTLESYNSRSHNGFFYQHFSDFQEAYLSLTEACDCRNIIPFNEACTMLDYAFRLQGRGSRVPVLIHDDSSIFNIYYGTFHNRIEIKEARANFQRH